MIVSIRRSAAVSALAITILAGAVPANAGSDSENLPWRGAKEDGYPVPQGPPSDRDYVPPRGSTKDDVYEPPHHEAPRRVAECLSKYGIRGALNSQGWHAFDNVEIRGNVAYMTAQNDGGRRFELRVDSCTGSVIDAQPRVVYVDREPPPRVYYEDRYYAPRPSIGLYFGGGGGHRRHW
jgi:hypothetical protein